MSTPTRQLMIVHQNAPRTNVPLSKVAFFGTDGSPLIVDAGAGALMTGYVAPSGSNITAADTVIQAIKKLDVRLRAAGTPL